MLENSDAVVVRYKIPFGLNVEEQGGRCVCTKVRGARTLHDRPTPPLACLCVSSFELHWVLEGNAHRLRKHDRRAARWRASDCV